MTQTLHQLEKLLCMWEDVCFYYRAFAPMVQAAQDLGAPHPSYPIDVGPFKHHCEYRRYLLNCKREEPFDSGRFIGPDSIVKTIGALSNTPLLLWSWSNSSRRIFHMTRELQALLDATSIDDVLIADVSFPFSSFAVTLDTPLQDGDGVPYDCILMTCLPDEQGSSQGIHQYFKVMRSSSVNYQPLAEKDRQALLFALKRKDVRKVEQYWNRAKNLLLCGKGVPVPGFYFHLALSESDTSVPGHTIGVSFNETAAQVGLPLARERFANMYDQVKRIVYGLCLYLTTLPSQNNHKSEWHKPPQPRGSFDPQAITSEAQVCTVSSMYTLTQEERELLGLEGEERQRAWCELRAHFRRGYWRRAPGYGHEPDAPKIVHVRPTLVRRDRLQQGQLPGGTEAVL